MRIKDVAGLAGVSIASVSHVTNNTRFVDDYRMVKSEMSKTILLKIRLAEGGGWAARSRPSSGVTCVTSL